MSTDEGKLSQLEREAPRAALRPVDIERDRCAVVFLSIDLVNSTAYKARSRQWPLVVAKFYESAVADMQSRLPDTYVWKYLGDEVIFFVEATDLSVPSDAVRSLFESLQTVVDNIHNAFPDTKGILNAKGSAWVANLNRPPQGATRSLQQLLSASPDGGLRNIVATTFTNLAIGPIEFVGQEIDLGFRISKFAHHGKVVVSPDLARLLIDHATERSHTASRLRRIGNEILKGIWNGRPCPIYWYTDKWEAIDSTFNYDEIGGDLHQNAREARETTDGNYISRVYCDVGLEDHYTSLRETISKPGFLLSEVAGEKIEVERLSEVHIVAVCMDDDRNILTFKRPRTKRLYPDKYEFGCVQLRRRQRVEDAIIDGYRSDYGIEVGAVSEVMIQRYYIDAKGVPGFVFAARVSGSKPSVKLAEGKRDEPSWRTIEEMSALGWDEFVPSAEDRATAALNVYDQIKFVGA